MQRSIYSTIETLVPRSENGGLENSNDYLQIFGEKGKTRKVMIIHSLSNVELEYSIIKIRIVC